MLVYLALATGILVFSAWLYALVGIVLTGKSLERKYPRICGGGAGVVAVVVARNELDNLRTLLPILLGHYGFSRVVLVDDGSSDGTPLLVEELSRRYSGRLVYVRVDSVPEGWAPKAYALSRGAEAADDDVLLFLDADVELLDPSTIAGLAKNTPPGVVLGFVPRFYCRSFTCKASQAAMTGIAYGFYGLHRVVDERDSLAWFYGCCWAIRRDTYTSLGGHKSVAASIVEDRAFASHAKRLGARIILVDARSVIHVKTYEDLRGYASLVARLALEPFARRGTAAKLVFTLATILILYYPLLLVVPALHTGGVMAGILLAPLALQLTVYSYGARIEGYSPLYAVPALIAQASVVAGLVYALRGRVYWKDRRLGVEQYNS